MTLRLPTQTIPAGVALFVVALVSGPASAVPMQWSPDSGGNGHYYEVVDTELNWQSASAAANAAMFAGEAGYLATITSAEEQDFIAALLGPTGVAMFGGHWMGANDIAAEGSFVWNGGPEAGNALSLERWGAGEPNDLGGEDCVLLSQNANRDWNDLSCVFSMPSVVEWTVATTAVDSPAPAALVLGGLALMLGVVKCGGMRRRHIA